MNKPIFNSLQFDNIDSLDHGIYITGESVYDSPERDVEAVEIAGRSGDYLLDKGRWENIEVTYHCGCFGDGQSAFANKIRNFRNLLASKRGYQRITDSYNPAEYRMGAFTNPVEVDAVSMKRAGEFDVVFNCKPQRYLMSGEAEQTITSGQTLFNPTPFEASPVIMAEGYGTIGFNGYSINIANVTIGKIDIYDGRTVTAPSRNTNTIQAVETFDLGVVNTGDDIAIGGMYQGLSKASDTIALVSGYTISGRRMVTDGVHGDSSAEITPSNTLKVEMSIDTTDIVVGTPLTATRSTTITIYCSNGSTTTDVEYTLEASIEYDGNHTVTYTVTRSFGSNPNSIAYANATLSLLHRGAVAWSTVSALGHPTYIDCELGEAYMIKNGEAISLNRYIDLGSDLPTLASGNNTITFSNTITSLKIIPKWWVL